VYFLVLGHGGFLLRTTAGGLSEKISIRGSPLKPSYKGPSVRATRGPGVLPLEERFRLTAEGKGLRIEPTNIRWKQ
jgi:hypothetical protein